MGAEEDSLKEKKEDGIKEPKVETKPIIKKKKNVAAAEEDGLKEKKEDGLKEPMVETKPIVKKKKKVAAAEEDSVTEKKKLKRKLSAVEESNSDKDKIKVRKSELDLLDGTIVSRRHGRTCTKDQEDTTTTKPEKKFKKPVIKGTKEKKSIVL